MNIDVEDNELIAMINEDSEDAKDILYDKYKHIIDILIKKYKNMAGILGVDYSDLYQEALVGFVDAINHYEEAKEAGLPRFITLCVDRRLQVAISKAGRVKNKIMNEALSLEHTYDYFKMPLMYILSDNDENNPLKNIVSEEDFKYLIAKIKEELSTSEYEVYSLMIGGLSYQDIAALLNKEPKQIDNTIQRIKIKVKKILEGRN